MQHLQHKPTRLWAKKKKKRKKKIPALFGIYTYKSPLILLTSNPSYKYFRIFWPRPQNKISKFQPFFSFKLSKQNNNITHILSFYVKSADKKWDTFCSWSSPLNSPDQNDVMLCEESNSPTTLYWWAGSPVHSIVALPQGRRLSGRTLSPGWSCDPSHTGECGKKKNNKFLPLCTERLLNSAALKTPECRGQVRGYFSIFLQPSWPCQLLAAANNKSWTSHFLASWLFIKRKGRPGLARWWIGRYQCCLEGDRYESKWKECLWRGLECGIALMRNIKKKKLHFIRCKTVLHGGAVLMPSARLVPERTRQKPLGNLSTVCTDKANKCTLYIQLQ